MKKFSTIAIALCLVFAMALPAMAKSDVEFDGHLRVRGFVYSNHSFNHQTRDTDAKFDSRWRTNVRINVSEDLWVRGRFHAWSGGRDLGTNPGGLGVNNPYGSTGSASMDRGWLAYKSPIGLLEVGRMGGGSWGLPFGDFDGDYDRIKLTTPLSDKLAMVAIFQKSGERDYGTTTSDQDSDTYYLVGNYAGETLTTGLLTAYSRNGSNKTDYFALVPYFKATMGAITLMGELGYEFGNVDAEMIGRPPSGPDRHYDCWTAGIEIDGNHGKFGWEAGWGYVSGQDPYYENDFTAGNYVYGGLGQDWDKFVYFTDTYGRALLNAYDAYNTAFAPNTPAAGGVNIWWVGANFSPKENLKCTVLLGMARALEYEFANSAFDWQGADYGTEADFKLAWTIVPNLEYNFNFGYVWAGDALATVMGVPKNNKDNALKCYHNLQLNF